MGKYSGIVLCSDFDGTLASRGEVSQKNCDAIKYFCDNGGIFSVISGRGIPFFVEREEQLCLRSYVGGANGTVVCYLPTRTVVDQGFVLPAMKDVIPSVLEFIGDNLKDILMVADGESFRASSIDGYMEMADKLPWERMLKCCIWSHEPFGECGMERISQLFGDEYLATRSGEKLCEITSAGASKGWAARRIAELVGAHTLVCVGDYENDMTLLQAADISYAVGNAIPKLKQIADRVTVTNKEDAIAAIIAEL